MKKKTYKKFRFAHETSVSSQRYFKCINMALGLNGYKGFNYMEFAQALNESWLNARTENDKNNVLNVYAKTLKELRD